MILASVYKKKWWLYYLGPSGAGKTTLLHFLAKRFPVKN